MNPDTEAGGWKPSHFWGAVEREKSGGWWRVRPYAQ